jgi:hypothetical protein
MSKIVDDDRLTLIKSLRQEGLSYGKIGEKIGLSRQRIYQILEPEKHKALCQRYEKLHPERGRERVRLYRERQQSRGRE